jgi:hypothetical protein
MPIYINDLKTICPILYDRIEELTPNSIRDTNVLRDISGFFPWRLTIEGPKFWKSICHTQNISELAQILYGSPFKIIIDKVYTIKNILTDDHRRT